MVLFLGGFGCVECLRWADSLPLWRGLGQGLKARCLHQAAVACSLTPRIFGYLGHALGPRNIPKRLGNAAHVVWRIVQPAVVRVRLVYARGSNVAHGLLS
jgi:hypothetical protein